MGNMAIQQGSWKIGTVLGIPLRLHYSWFIIFGLITWSLSFFAGLPSGFWFLYSAAQSSYQQSTLQESLAGIKVKEVMGRQEDLITLSPHLAVETAINDYF